MKGQVLEFTSRELPEYSKHTHAHDLELGEVRGRWQHQDPVGGAVSLSVFLVHGRKK